MRRRGTSERVHDVKQEPQTIARGRQNLPLWIFRLYCMVKAVAAIPVNMHFEIVGDISAVETFATGPGIRELPRLQRVYGKGRWRKRKGIATVRLQDSSLRTVELHWYEATGIGKKEFKIKEFLD